MAAASTVSQAAVSQAASAADLRTASLTAAAVLSKALEMAGSAPYPAPNGNFGFSPSGELLNPAIPVYTDVSGHAVCT